MGIVLHPPEAVQIDGDLGAEDRRRVTAAILRAVERALEKAAAAGPHPARLVGPATGADRFDPRRAAAGAYLLPSYDDAGELKGVKLVQDLGPAKSGVVILSGAGPVAHALVSRMHGNRYVNLAWEADRYVAAGTLTEAFLLGNAVLATTSYAIVQGPIGSKDMRYIAFPTEDAVSDADLGEGSRAPVEGEPELTDVAVVPGEIMSPVLRGVDGEYLLRGLVPTDRKVHWPNENLVLMWKGQIAAESQAQVLQEPGYYRVLIFDDIDALVDEYEGGDKSHLQHAAEMLSRLDAQAFSLVPWETKVRYLKVLLDAWTWEEEEKAVVEIFKSLQDDSEVDAVVAMLKEADKYNKLFNDLDSQVYDLLVAVGEKFPRDHGPLTVDQLIALCQSFGLIPKSTVEALTGIETGPDGTVVTPDLLDEAQELAMGFVRFGSDLGESVWTLVTKPWKVAEGIGALVQLIIKVDLAQAGYPPAVAEVSAMLAHIAEQVLYGMRGADRLGVGEKILRRIKYRLIWEIASFFVGVGEVKAAIQAVGLSEKLAGVVRLLGILARLGEAADAEIEGARLVRLAELLKAEGSAFKSADEVAELLSHLPEDDVRKLGRLLAKNDLKEGEKLADLAARSSELHEAVSDALSKTDLLRSLVDKSGGLTEEVAEAFRALVGREGVDVGAAQKVVRAIPDGEGARFAAALKRIPLGRLAADSRGAVLELVAGSAKRMDAVLKVGFDTFAGVLRRSAGNAEQVDRYVAALESLESKLGAAGKQADYRRLLDGLERGDTSSWLRLENESRLAAGERPVGEWIDQLAGSPRAQSGLDKLLRRRGDHVVDGLIDDLAADRGLISDREVVDALEKVDQLSDRELDGMVELQRYMDRGGNYPTWDDLLDEAPPALRRHLLESIADLRDPANPGNLVVRDGLDQALQAALVPSGGTLTGGFGHFEAARSLLREFPGAQMRFELTRVTSAGQRDVDIVLEFAGREVDVEVKGYRAVDVRGRMSHVADQIRKDLLNHISDPGGPWANVLWRFPDPGYASELGTVEQVFIEQLQLLDRQGRLTMPLPAAESALRGRFAAAPPWRLVDVLR